MIRSLSFSFLRVGYSCKYERYNTDRQVIDSEEAQMLMDLAEYLGFPQVTNSRRLHEEEAGQSIPDQRNLYGLLIWIIQKII